jgi:parallel beta-helix repeat protein
VDDDNTEGPWYGSQEHPYQRVQDGVDNARSGDLVFIFNGHYIEPTIGIWYKQLSLVGENKFETIIECSKRVGYVNNVISICHSHGVLISDLTLQKSGNITGPWEESGIWFLNASNNTVTGNIIRDCAYGIHMLHEHNNNITGNTFFNNSYRGIYIFQSNNNSVYENIFIENHDGIYIREAFDNIISGNKFSFNKYGHIHFTSGASDNYILDNTFTGNRDGVYINGASGNYIYHNNFLGNRDNAYDDSTNSWYDSYLSGGNFWIDYLGADNDDDGFGDTPYLIRGGINNDMYPLIDPWNNGNKPPLSLKITGQTAGKIGKEYEYTFNTVDPNNNEVYYWIDWGDGRQEKWIGPFNSGMDIKVKHSWNREGGYTIKVIAINTNYSTSPWVTLEVKMPREKSLSNSFLLRFLDKSQPLQILLTRLGLY